MRHERTVTAIDAGPSFGTGHYQYHAALPNEGAVPNSCAVEEQTTTSFGVQTAAPAASSATVAVTCECAPTLPHCTGWLHWVVQQRHQCSTVRCNSLPIGDSVVEPVYGRESLPLRLFVVKMQGARDNQEVHQCLRLYYT